jgi:acetyl-CoA carboxylase, biotin carboxylase subunit
MIRRILIANRGEIAARIIRTCRDLGINSVLAASEADMAAVPARLADEVICIGPPPPGQSYLNPRAVVSAAKARGADAIHPGYGFLSENATLAEECDKAGIVFVGPTVKQLAAVGDKVRARENAVAAKVPVVPGGSIDDAAEAEALAGKIGYPVLIKAVGGGGGRGMKLVEDPAKLAHQIELAMAEADAAFKDSRVYLERFVKHGRHVEVQLLGDGKDIVHLGSRDCSIQRRYQKLVEEAPAPALSDSLHQKMLDSAVDFGRHLAYRGAGTVEFLVDCDRDDFYFLEMNARIQVEHPVTEAITGVDLVAEQIAIADGQGLRLAQSDIRFSGHALECRINAEDTAHDFRPSPGTVARALWPAGEGIRVDTHIESGAVVPPFYDSLVGKIITWGADRPAALKRMRQALASCRIDGIATNIALHAALMADPGFAEGGVTTSYFPRFLKQTIAAE